MADKLPYAWWALHPHTQREQPSALVCIKLEDRHHSEATASMFTAGQAGPGSGSGSS